MNPVTNRVSVLRGLAVLPFLAAAMLPAAAFCGDETSLSNTVPGWYYRMPSGTASKTNNVYLTVDAADAIGKPLLYFGGIYMPTGMEDMVNMRGLAFLSQDSGATVQDVAGSAVGATLTAMCTPVDIDVVYPGLTPPQATVWASCGSSLALSADGGKFDRKFDAPMAGDDADQINCIHMFDGGRGVAGAESGAIYLFELSGDGRTVAFTPAQIENVPSAGHASASPAIVTMHWLSDGRGWAVAVDGETLTENAGMDDEKELQMYYQTRVYSTTDGGKTWVLAGTVDLNPTEDAVHQVTFGGKPYPLSFEGGWLPKEIRMVDRDNGFLALVAWDNTKQISIVAKILKTTDGGKNWTDLAANMQVGTMNSMFAQPILMSDVAGMYAWKDADGVARARVAGRSFVSEGSSGMGGTPPKFFYLTMISTADGGVTWTKSPELGEVTWDFASGGDPINTPRPVDAVFLDQYRGFAVGDKGTVFRFQYKCTKQSECDFGYFCNPGTLTCLSCADIDLAGGHQGSVDQCSTWTPPPDDEELAGRDAYGPGNEDAVVLVDATGERDLAGWDGKSGDGCSAGTGGSAGAAAALMTLAAIGLVMARRRARIHRR